MKPHRTDTVSLAFGVLFLAVTAWWLTARLVDLTLPAAGWFLAAAMILLGLFGLVGVVRSSHARTPQEGAGPTGTDREQTVSFRPNGPGRPDEQARVEEGLGDEPR